MWISLLWFYGLLFFFTPGNVSADLFGYKGNIRNKLDNFPQWLSVLERNIKQNAPLGKCETNKLDQCHVKNWMMYLESIRHLSKEKQINKVNFYANKHEYILDIENYGVNDFWATPGEFLYNSGDCEDYAITKMLSLKILGFDMRSVRLIVLQDTNLRVPHAVLAVNTKNDILIMDNQIDEVISHKHVLHYVPIYAVNENNWWMFLPK